MSTDIVISRVDALKQQIMRRKGSFVESPDCFIPDLAFYHSYHDGISRVRWRAGALLQKVRLGQIQFPPMWRLAGEHLAQTGCALRDPKTELPVDPRLTREEWRRAREAAKLIPDWGNLPVSQSTSKEPQCLPGSTDGWIVNDETVCMSMGWIENHSIRDYAKVLRLGYEGLLAEVKAAFAGMKISHPDYIQRENFLLAAQTVCEAGILLGQRYADAAKCAQDGATTPEDCERFRLMAEACAQVPARGARTFHEATQALWLAHILTCGEDGINANSIGRLDQILYPYYLADRNAGHITREEAVELMAELACKLYLDYDVQTITLGGQNADGSDATNELSSIILDATDRVGFIRALNVRIHPKTPDTFLRQAAALVIKGGGIPYIFNDECYIDALSKRGIALEDARGYAVIGCVELTIPGKANPHAVSGWLNTLKCLELALNSGTDPRTGNQTGALTKPFTEMKSFDEFFAAYKAQVEAFAQRMVYYCNRNELRQREGGPLPCWSLLTDDCIKRGRDITDGGAKYFYHSICLMGAPNTADALAAVKQLVFEEKAISPEELLRALQANYEGYDNIRAMLCTRASKYGNDREEVDLLAADVCSHFIQLMDMMRSPLGGRYFVHLFTFLMNLPYGKATGATPDGRRAGEPIAYSLSAHQGRDEKGLTAMIRSLSRLPHREAAGGSAAILDIIPDFLKGSDGTERLATIIRSAFAMGVGQLQFNVVMPEQMKKAKEDPEHHGNLQVRVAGFSQMFKLLTPELQNHLIARTKHAG